MRPRGPDAHEPAMQANGHHLRARLALCVERVEAVLEIGEELVAGIEACGRGEAHVVCIERVGHDEEGPVPPRAFGPST